MSDEADELAGRLEAWAALRSKDFAAGVVEAMQGKLDERRAERNVLDPGDAIWLEGYLAAMEDAATLMAEALRRLGLTA